MKIAAEARTLIRAALAGDPALASLAVAGSSPPTLVVKVEPGIPAKAIGGLAYAPEPPFRRETLAELVLRVQRLRWQRVAPITRLLDPPQERDLSELRVKHLRATVSFECYPGWADLLSALFTWLEEIAPDREWSPRQIKEKYGTLRFYWHGDLPERAVEIIKAAEHLSGHICELCGAPGMLRSQHGWWTTRCHEHKNGHSS